MYLKKRKEYKVNLNNTKRVLVSSDFETIPIKKEHIVYAIGLVNEYDIYKEFYISYTDEEEQTNSHTWLKEQSLLLIKEYLLYLLETYSNKQKTFIYFHNLRRFDGVFIIKAIDIYFKDYKKNILIHNNMIYKIEISNLVFLDFKNLFSDSLDNLSKLFLGKAKNKFKIHSILKYEDCFNKYAEITKYLNKDVVLLQELVSTVRKLIITNFKLDIVKHITISNLSFNIYRLLYYKDEYEIFITKGYYYNFIKSSYFGGLCNIIRPYLSKGYYYDINSLYPKIMLEYDMPTGKPENIYIISKLDNIDEYFGFIRCEIYVPKQQISPLCIYKNNTLIQAVGYLKGTWFTEEIKFALTVGCKIQKIEKIIHFKKKKKVFSNFVSDLYKKRLNSNHVILKQFYKLIMNSLYGRFGINYGKEHTVFIKESEVYLYEYICDVNRIERTNFYTILLNYELAYEFFEILNNKKVIIKDEELLQIKKIYNTLNIKNEIGYSSVHISSAISSYARIYLLKDMYKHIKNGGNIYYYDTDSIFTDKRLNDTIINENIGSYKLEDKIYKAFFISPKLYCYINYENKYTIKFKGLDISDIDKIYKIAFWENLLKLNHNDFNIAITKMRTSINKLKVLDKETNYSFNFKTKKYIKNYDENNIWISTSPIEIEKETDK